MAWLPIVIYVPALAFNQGKCGGIGASPPPFNGLLTPSSTAVTGVNVHLVTPIVCIVCIFYTCVGGLKAVVWTDVVQLMMMFGAICLVMVKGTADIGGWDVVWDRASSGQRLEAPE